MFSFASHSSSPFRVRLRIAVTAIMSLWCALLLSTLAHGEPLPANDKSFVRRATDLSNAAISASQLALEKTDNPDVKNFAALMLDDHSTQRDDIKKLAASKDVLLPDRPSMRERAKLAVLERLDGKLFDQQYVAMFGVAAHHHALRRFSKAAEQAEDPDVRHFAETSMPSLQHHLELASALKARLDAAE